MDLWNVLYLSWKLLFLVLLFCGLVGFCLFGCIGRNKDVWLRVGYNNF